MGNGSQKKLRSKASNYIASPRPARAVRVGTVDQRDVRDNAEDSQADQNKEDEEEEQDDDDEMKRNDKAGVAEKRPQRGPPRPRSSSIQQIPADANVDVNAERSGKRKRMSIETSDPEDEDGLVPAGKESPNRTSPKGKKAKPSSTILHCHQGLFILASPTSRSHS
jgi:hypothetical protein